MAYISPAVEVHRIRQPIIRLLPEVRAAVVLLPVQVHLEVPVLPAMHLVQEATPTHRVQAAIQAPVEAAIPTAHYNQD